MSAWRVLRHAMLVVTVALTMLEGMSLARGEVGSAAYHLACIRVNEQDTTYPLRDNNRVHIYALNESGNLLGPALQILGANVAQITSEGRLLREAAYPGTDAYRFSFTEPLRRRWVEAARMKSLQADYDDVLSTDVFLDEREAGQRIREYLREYSLYDSAVHEEPSLRSSRSSTVLPANMISASRQMAVISVGIYDRRQQPEDSKYAICHELLFLFDFATSTVHHVAGSDKDRCFISGYSLWDGKVTFYRSKNFASIMLNYDANTPELIAEGGWEVCCYDIEKRQLEVLVKNPYRWDPWPGGVVGSPDGTKLVFLGCFEPYGLDRQKYAPPAAYVLDMAGRSWTRLTVNNWRAGIVAWAPDSRRLLAYIIASPRAQPESAAAYGYWALDIVSGQATPVMLLDERGRSAQGLRYFRTFRWSPDGKYIAFCARFERDGQQYDGLFVMPVDRPEECRPIDFARIAPKVRGKSWVDVYFDNPVWLTAE